LKIAYLVNEYPKVSHSFIRREIQALERQGLEVLRIALRGWEGPLPDEEDQRERARSLYVLRGGSRSLIVPVFRSFFRSPRRLIIALRLAWLMARQTDRPFAYHLAYLAEACKVLPWLKIKQIEWLHAHFGTNSAEVAMLTHSLGGPPYSFTAHGPEEFMRPVGLPEKIRRAAFVIAISSFGKSQLCLSTPYDQWNKIHIIRCGIEKEFCASLTTPFPQSRRLICVGRLNEAKGQPLLIEAAAILAQRKVAFELVFAGDGSLRRTLESLINKFGLQDRTRITGWISSAQVRTELLASRALVLPSFSEGLPVAIMESMALKRPVLTTYVAGIPELVIHRETGWMFPAGSVDALALAMEECLLCPIDTIEKMGEAAFQRVAKLHALDAEAAKLAELFRAESRSTPSCSTISART
jgi:colanic acid/amylovoran biosynthesis glycosyltransferase